MTLQNRLRKKSSQATSHCVRAYAEGETLTSGRLAVSVVAFSLVLAVCDKADAQKVDAPSPTSQEPL